ncbi:MAG: alpha/beta hydrolase [Actinobacteria bacterium]|nr:alpha/beta hydrolase [Actinomycetota bacterium]
MAALAVRGVELEWSERGEGAPVLLVHETGVDSAAWEPVAGALATSLEAPGERRRGARAILYDRRGWGGSSAPEGYRRTTIEEQSGDAAALLERLGAGPAVIAGAGIGAVIALDLLLRRPALVAGAMLVEPPLLALVPAATEQLSADLDSLAQSADRGRDALVELYLSGGLGALGAGAERLPPGLTAAARERPAGLVAELGASSAWGMPLTRLGDAERPSLVVTADSTPPLLADAAKALGGRLPGAAAEVVAASAMPPHLAEPARIAALARELSA